MPLVLPGRCQASMTGRCSLRIVPFRVCGAPGLRAELEGGHNRGSFRFRPSRGTRGICCRHDGNRALSTTFRQATGGGSAVLWRCCLQRAGGRGCFFRLWHAGQKLLGNQHHRTYTTVRRGRIDGNAESVACGQHSDDRETELRRISQCCDVGGTLRRQQIVGPLLLLLVHTDTCIVDDDADTLGHGAGGDVDGGVRRGVTGRVVEQFRECQGDRFHRPAGHREVALRADLDPGVVADSSLCAAHHVVDRGVGPLPAEPAVTENGDRLGSPAELRVHVVDFQEILQHIVLAVFPLRLGDGQLLFVGETLQRPHRGFQRTLGGVLRTDPRLVHGTGVAVFEFRVAALDGRLFPACLASGSALAEDDGGSERRASDQSPERWILYVMRHETLFKRLDDHQGLNGGTVLLRPECPEKRWRRTAPAGSGGITHVLSAAAPRRR
ncbi:hypothetical protein SCOCK_620032 [Actinacidiphila cocklensis]|uniref:Uncharacterized protein n=1 Tax=Actinacidiphila cocklensis TaxID=887465 RepID=A0A9W4E2Q6_9ACTN|nr:hypothetical protein SCOCK_620032 [Actinacidiphila cocklensis]